MKKIIAVLLAVTLLALAMVGCGQSSGSPEPSNTASAKPSKNTPVPSGNSGEKKTVTIEFWNSAEGAMATSVEHLVKQFNETVGKEKGIIVESIFQGGDVVEKLKTLAQAGDYKNFPNVGQIYAAGLSALFAMDDPLLFMEDIYSSGKYDISVAKEDIVENFIRSYTYEGKWVGMPLNASTMLMYYNKDAAREAGLDPEKPPKVMAELAEWTKKLTKRAADGSIERYGLNIQIDRYELVNFLIGIGKNGVNYIGDNEGGRTGMMTKLTIGEDGSLMKFLNEWEKVIATGGFKPVNDDERGEFANGLSAINFQSSAQLTTMIKNTEGKFELGVAPIPRATEEDNVGAAVGGGSLCMFNVGSDEEKKASFEFVQFMASPESQLYFFKNNGYLPANKKSSALEEYKAYIASEPHAQVAVDQLLVSHPDMQEPFDLIMSEMNSITKTNLIDFANGTITKQECHDNIVNGFNAKLSEYIRANR